MHCFTYAAVTLFALIPQAVLESTCDTGDAEEQIQTITVRLRKKASGEWVTSFSASKDILNNTEGLDVDVGHRVVKCGTKQTVHVTGVIREASAEEGTNLVDGGVGANNCSVANETGVPEVPQDKLHFHPKAGKSIAIINNGRTAYRQNPLTECCYGGAFSNRPLKDGELFEVAVDEINGKWPGSSFILAVTAATPESLEFPSWTGSIAAPTWFIEYDGVYRKGIIKPNYGIDLRNLKVGDRVGVMRKGNVLYFTNNGLDKGVAATDIPTNVYGVVEIRGYVTKVSLVG